MTQEIKQHGPNFVCGHLPEIDESMEGSIGIKPNLLGNNVGVSYNFTTTDGQWKRFGTMFPTPLIEYTTRQYAESTYIIEGLTLYRYGNHDWQSAGPGEWMNIPSNTVWQMKILETIYYVNHVKV